ncbi:MAG: hypothetical protein R3F17_06510 [Planctomycetota bacterium]
MLSRKMEERLANSKSAQIPVRADVPRPASMRSDFKVMAVDYQKLGQELPARTQELKDMFLNTK